MVETRNRSEKLINNKIHFAISQPGHGRNKKSIRKTYRAETFFFQIYVSLRIWWLQISAILPSGINNISSCFLSVLCRLKLKIPRYYFSDWSLPFAPIIERHSSASCHVLQNNISHVDPLASGAFLGLFFWLNRNRTPLPSSGLLRIWNANPTPLGPSPFHLTTPPMTLLKRLDSAPDPLLSLTSSLDSYFSYVIHTSTPLHNSISIYSDEVRGRTQFHWILLSSKVYLGLSWLYIWYTSAYI